ncbi:hypothetical protein ACWGDX_03055 [Streptomyces sp. NPDC055025]
MADFATIADLEDRLGRDLADESEQRKAAAHLTDASVIIRGRFPALPDPPPAIVLTVCCAMVLRVLTNPEGKREESIDDYRYVIDSSRSTGEIYLSDTEAEEIEDALKPPNPRSTAFSIVPGAPAVP